MPTTSPQRILTSAASDAASALLQAQAVPHLCPEAWAVVSRQQVQKMLSEFAHERLVEPVADAKGEAGGLYHLQTEDPQVLYRFWARKMALEHWDIDPFTIEKLRAGRRAPLDAIALVLELRDALGIDSERLPTYLEELNSTLYSAAYRWERERFDAAALARADFQDIEAGMTAGHPCFVANHGRIGFDAQDLCAYAPEAGSPMALLWLAAHRERAAFAAVDGVVNASLMESELGELHDLFHERLRRRGLRPEDYLLMPVHPWQWSNRVATAFAADIATERLVYLGPSQDRYLAQQSIRTLFNQTSPARCYVKTALSILNMGFVRGLSPYYMGTTPAINQWIDEVLRSDPYLRQRGFAILREIATVAYRQPDYEAASPPAGAHTKMLAALFRESPVPLLAPGQRLMTMAALLHCDRQGRALLAELIASSGLSTDAWLERYLDVYFLPVLHCFFFLDLVCMPHGENLILVLQDGVPVRAFLKDIAEEMALLEGHERLPEGARRLAVAVPEPLRLLSIFTDVFDCFFRFLAPTMQHHCDYPEARFWEQVAESVRQYQQDHPELKAKFKRYDMFAPSFGLSCLNRLQLRNNRQLIDLADPSAALQFAGELANPIAAVDRPR